MIPENTRVLIEEKLVGEEFSLMSITDGNGNIQHFEYKILKDFMIMTKDQILEVWVALLIKIIHFPF